MGFPYTFDQVIDAISSTSGDGAHFVLLGYLLTNRDEVGVARFRRLLESAHLRGGDAMNVHLAMSTIDPAYALELPAVLKSARSIDSQQIILTRLPDVLPHNRHDAVADTLERWIVRRVQRPSYWEFGAIWEVPSVVLSVLHVTDIFRARDLLAVVHEHLDDEDQRRAQDAQQATDADFESRLDEWRSLHSTSQRSQIPREELVEALAAAELDAARYMRRLGFAPAR
jgi:hypothetical protein